MKKKLHFLWLIFAAIQLNAQQYEEASGLVVMEAENLNLVSGWSVQSSASGFTGSGYINNTDAEYFNNPGNNTISTQIKINTPGTYRFQWRNKVEGISCPSGICTDNNDTWLRFDDADEFYIANIDGVSGIKYPHGSGQSPNPNGAGSGNWLKVYSNNQGWNWNTQSSDFELRLVFVTFNSPGIYTMEVSARSINHTIDRMVLYNSSLTESAATNLSNSETLFSGSGTDENTTGTISGELKRYHKVTLTWGGLYKTEQESTFKDNRLNVTFTSPTNKTYVVPGYFAADGNAGETSAANGTKWRCHFTPLETGTWNYSVSFRTGLNIAASTNPNEGTPVNINGDSGSFTIAETDKTGKDFRGKGKLEYVGEHHLKWTNGDYFLKFGANSPETFLEFQDFDGTASNRTYSVHATNDFQSGLDPVWQGSKGKGIIGAINYLSNQGMNSQYFLTMNSYGDGGNAYPWIGNDSYYTYDTSKLDQWQIVFDHMMEKGVMPNLVMTEQENQSYFEFNEGGTFANSRKVYYRELAARFGYLNAITWNIGEENGWQLNQERGKATTNSQRIAFASYLSSIIPYDDNITVHNGPANEAITNQIYNGLLGMNEFTGISYQAQYQLPSNGHNDVLHWIEESKNAGKNWVVYYDEPFIAPSPNNTHLESWRKNSLWAALTAGSSGIELFFGILPLANNPDVVTQNYNTYSDYWATMKRAKDFFETNTIPFYEMSNADDILTGNAWCLAKDSNTYVIYLASGGSTTIDLPGSTGYSVQWYDPRNGGALQDGSVTTVNSGDNIGIGNPPNSTGSDWVALIKSTNPPSSGSFPIRINTAGNLLSATDGETDWLDNSTVGAQSIPGVYSVNTGRVASSSTVMTEHSSIPAYIDQATFDAIFTTERWDFEDTNPLEMEYTIDVPNGSYVVNLFMGNKTNHTSTVGTRVFDIEIEGNIVKDDLDLITEFGHQVGGMLSFPVDITDGAINLRFLHEVENPLVNAIEIQEAPTPSSGTVRINTAGSLVTATDGESDWADNSLEGAINTSIYSVNTGRVAPTNITPSRHSSIPSYVDTATFNSLFASERWDFADATEMEYILPASNGDYVLNLYMVNTTNNTSTPGTRVFDIEIEGTVVRDNMDISAEFGHRVGGMLSFPVTVTDGAVNLRFLHEVENPLVNAIELREAPTPVQEIVRINTAGSLLTATDADSDWVDNSIEGAMATSTYSVNTGRVGILNFPMQRHSSIPPYVDTNTFDTLFATERWDFADATEMEYSIPVTNGDYVVNLYMGNKTNHTSTVGTRVFDIELEGSIVRDDLDLITEFGHQIGGMLSFPVTVTDGIVNLRFLHEVENPLVNAVEIRPASTPPTTTQTTPFTPIHDAYLQGTNLGNELGNIRIEFNNRVGYLMYDLSNINGTITDAELQFTVSSDAGSGTIEVYQGNGTNWTETNLSSSNVPSENVLLGGLNGSYTVGTDYSIPLSPQTLSGGGLLSLVVKHLSGGNDLDMASKENGTYEPVRLVLTYETTGSTALKANLNLGLLSNNVMETLNQEEIVIFPNPTTQGITIQGLKGESSIGLTDFGGKLLFETNSQGARSIDIELHDYPAGIYILSLKDISGTKSFKVVKQ